MTITGAGFLVTALVFLAACGLWCRRGRSMAERRVDWMVHNALEHPGGWRSWSMFNDGRYIHLPERRRLALKLWRLVSVTLGATGVVTLAAAVIAFSK